MDNSLILQIKQKIHETPDTFIYILEALKGKLIYKAGQFLTFLFYHTGKEIRRSYSISSCPSIDPYIAIVVKRVSNGEISRYIQDNWKIGDEVVALPPAGVFVLEESPKPCDVFMFGAGSGITPLFSILKEILFKHNHLYPHLYYSNQNQENTIFYQEIIKLKQHYTEEFDVEFFFSESKFLLKARLHRSLIEELISKRIKYTLQDALFYLCGPYEYMQMVEIVLLGMGIEKSNIRKEQFVVEKLEAPPFELADKRPKKVQLLLRGRKYDLIVPFNKSILDVAIENKINAPYNCQAGKCSACVAKCINGKVIMSYNEVLTDRDEQKGLVLTCTGHPLSDDVVLEY